MEREEDSRGERKRVTQSHRDQPVSIAGGTLRGKERSQKKGGKGIGGECGCFAAEFLHIMRENARTKRGQLRSGARMPDWDSGSGGY